MILKTFDGLPHGAGFNETYDLILEGPNCSKGFKFEVEHFFQLYEEEALYVIKGKDLWDVLVRLGVYASRSAASKDGRYPRFFESGWKEYVIGKRKLKLYTMNPSRPLEYDQA
jgi:hypothetical protein